VREFYAYENKGFPPLTPADKLRIWLEREIPTALRTLYPGKQQCQMHAWIEHLRCARHELTHILAELRIRDGQDADEVAAEVADLLGECNRIAVSEEQL
jgi:hypothetical protein